MKQLQHIIKRIKVTTLLFILLLLCKNLFPVNTFCEHIGEINCRHISELPIQQQNSLLYCDLEDQEDVFSIDSKTGKYLSIHKINSTACLDEFISFKTRVSNSPDDYPGIKLYKTNRVYRL